MNVAGPGVEGVIETSLEGLKELWKAINNHRVKMKQLDQDDLEMIHASP